MPLQPAFKVEGTAMDGVLDVQYEAQRGWDRATGWPTRERLEALDLGDVADKMAQAGKLPA